MLSSDFLFPRFFVVPQANPSNFSHCKCFSSRIVNSIFSGRQKTFFMRLMHSGSTATTSSIVANYLVVL